MIGAAPADVEAFLVAFCRLAAFIMAMPGFSSLRVPVTIRLYLAVSLSVAAIPMVLARPVISSTGLPVEVIVSEIVWGAALGLLVRIQFFAMSFAAHAIGSFTSIGTMPGAPVDEAEPQPAVVTLITLAALALFFATGLHGVAIAGVYRSFEIIPPGTMPDWSVLADRFSDILNEAFRLMLQIAMPFAAYALIVNLAIGLLNRMVPLMPVYFVSMPFVVAGGVLLLHAHLPTALLVQFQHMQSGLRAVLP